MLRDVLRAAEPTGRKSAVMRGYPLIGVLPDVLRDFPKLLLRAAHEYPNSVVELDLGLTRAYFVSHPDHVQQVLSDWRGFGKGSMWDPLKQLLGNGMVTSEGETWLRSRRLVQSRFTPKYLVGLCDIMARVIADEVRRLEQIPPDRAVDMDLEMMHVTQKVMFRTLFGHEMRPDEGTRVEQALHTALRTINRRMLLYFLPERLPLPGERIQRQAIRTIDESILHVIAERRASNRQDNDLLSLFLHAHEQERAISDRQLRDELVTLFVTGHETTANVLTWCLHLLEAHPEVYRRVMTEIETVLADREPSFEDLASLRYMRMVLEETMRLYPSGWIIPRLVRESRTIDGKTLRASLMMLVSPYVTHRLEAFWDAPEEFLPEHFSSERADARHPYSYIPFGAGPRQCIGNHFAMMEAQLVLALLLRRLRFRRVPGHEVRLRTMPTLRPRNGLWMRLERTGESVR